MQIPVHKIKDPAVFIKWRDMVIDKNDHESAHRHDYFQLMMLEEAKGTHEIDFRDYTARNESFHFVGKGRVHKVDFDENVKVSVILFPEEIFSSSPQDLKLLASFDFFNTEALPVLELEHEDFMACREIMMQLGSSLKGDNFDVSKYLLFALLSRIREFYAGATGRERVSTGADEIVLFNRLLQQHAKEWNTIDPFLNEGNITASRLNALCKKNYGKTAMQLLHERKLLEAKRLLVYTDKQIKEVAYDCGFEDVAYFNRFFKRYTGTTPNAFRKEH